MKTALLIIVSTFFLSFQIMAQKNETPAKPNSGQKNTSVKIDKKEGTKKPPSCTLITAKQLPPTTGTVVRHDHRKAPSPM